MPAAAENMPARFSLLHFMVDKLYCCLDVQEVVQIISLVDSRPVPGGPDYLLGLANLHGKSIEIIDLGQRMGHQRNSKYDIDTPVILASKHGKKAGMVVSEIFETQPCSSRELQTGPEFIRGNLPYRGAVNYRGELSLLLDLERILDIQPGNTVMSPMQSTVRGNDAPISGAEYARAN